MLKKVFNSLGSNYDWRGIRELVGGDSGKMSRRVVGEQIKKYLRREKSEVILFYKAREALEAGCKIIGARQQGKWAVAVTGFTCYVVERAIMRAGGEVVFVDVGENQLNFDLKNLQAAYKKNPHIKAVLLQNTFGLQMREFNEVVEWCREKGLVVIEDCAHNIGANYQIKNGGLAGEWGIEGGTNGPRAGSIGEMAIMSFSQDKVIDAVSGGCLVINTSQISDFASFGRSRTARPKKIDAQRADSTSALNFCPKQSNSSNLESISVGVVEPMAGKQQWKDRAYPIRTWRIRTFYGVGVGKMMHWWLKKRKKLSNPMQYMGDEDEKLHEMTSMAKRSVREKMREHNLEKELTRRRKIAMVYYQKLGAEKRFLEVTSANIQNGSLVRYPVKLKNKEQREKLVRALERRGFYLGDVWYDTVVAPSKYFGKSKYKRRSCPRGEKLAQVIFNLPTHRNISEKEARRLGEVVERLG